MHPDGYHAPIPGIEDDATAAHRRGIRRALGLDDPAEDGAAPGAAAMQVACLVVAAEVHCAACDHRPTPADLAHMVDRAFHVLALSFLDVAWRQFADARSSPFDRKDITDAIADD